MGAIVFLVSIIGVLLSAVMFEAGFHAMCGNTASPAAKPLAARIWWSVVGLISFAVSPASGLLQLPLFLVVGLSHISMCHAKDDVITVVEILGHIPDAMRETAARIRPFLK